MLPRICLKDYKNKIECCIIGCDIFAKHKGGKSSRRATSARVEGESCCWRHICRHFEWPHGVHNGVCAVLASWFCVSSSKISFSSLSIEICEDIFRLSLECRVNLSLVPNKLRAAYKLIKALFRVSRAGSEWGNRENFETEQQQPRIAAVWGRSAPRVRLNLGGRWERAELTLNANLCALSAPSK